MKLVVVVSGVQWKLERKKSLPEAKMDADRLLDVLLSADLEAGCY